MTVTEVIKSKTQIIRRQRLGKKEASVRFSSSDHVSKQISQSRKLLLAIFAAGVTRDLAAIRAIHVTLDET